MRRCFFFGDLFHNGTNPGSYGFLVGKSGRTECAALRMSQYSFPKRRLQQLLARQPDNDFVVIPATHITHFFSSKPIDVASTFPVARNRSANMIRARLSRDATVPIGQSSARAASE